MRATIDRMKETITVLTVITIVLILQGFVGMIESHDVRDAKVIAIEDDEIIIEDNTHNIFAFVGNEYKVNDKVKVTFFNNYTDTRTDDEITKVKLNQ